MQGCCSYNLILGNTLQLNFREYWSESFFRLKERGGSFASMHKLDAGEVQQLQACCRFTIKFTTIPSAISMANTNLQSHNQHNQRQTKNDANRVRCQ